MTRVGAVAIVLTAVSVSSAARAPQQPPVVKKGNRVLANLTAKDFRLTDNGVEQKIEAVSIESVSVDVSLFLDTSGSTSGKLDDLKRDVQGIVRMLRAGDRFRLLTIADSVDEPVHWVPAGTAVNLSFSAVGGISLVHDARVEAVLHRPEADRRHLVVGMTSGRRSCARSGRSSTNSARATCCGTRRPASSGAAGTGSPCRFRR